MSTPVIYKLVSDRLDSDALQTTAEPKAKFWEETLAGLKGNGIDFNPDDHTCAFTPREISAVPRDIDTSYHTDPALCVSGSYVEDYFKYNPATEASGGPSSSPIGKIIERVKLLEIQAEAMKDEIATLKEEKAAAAAVASSSKAK